MAAQVAAVADIWVYPVKSLRGFSVNSSLVGARGIGFDRRWMVVTQKNSVKEGKGTHRFLSQRTCPRMATIDVDLGYLPDDIHRGPPYHLILSSSGKKPIVVPLLQSGRTLAVDIWNDTVFGAVDQGDDVSDWLTSALCGANFDRPVRLVYMPDNVKRMVNEKYDVKGNPSIVSFADGLPLLLASAASMRELNARMPRRMPINRFRANIIIDGDGLEPFEEDDWDVVRIGNVEFSVAKACTRCKLPSTNQKTGHQTGFYSDPLSTLREFRADSKGDLYFGQNLIPMMEAGIPTPWVQKGDRVVVTKLKTEGSAFREGLGRAPPSAFRKSSSSLLAAAATCPLFAHMCLVVAALLFHCYAHH